MSRRDPTRRLTILVTNLDRGGAETQAVRLAVGLAGRGWDVRMLSLLPPRDFLDDLAAAGVPVRGLGLRGAATLPAAAVRLFSELRTHRPHVLAAFTYHANVLGKVVGRLAGVPGVTGSFRNINFGGRVRQRLEALTTVCADKVTVNSRLVGEDLVRRRIAPRAKLVVIPNAAPPRAAPPSTDRIRALRNELGAGPEDLLWLSVSRFEPAKDVPGLLDAFARHAAGHPHSRLALVGYGSLEPEVRRLAAAHPAAERILLTGRREDVSDVLAAVDAFVMASAWEGLPNTVQEAALAGVPVAATDVGGVRELLGDDADLAPPRAPAALAAVMDRLADRPPAERRAHAETVRAALAARTDPEAVLDRWEDLFRRLRRD